MERKKLTLKKEVVTNLTKNAIRGGFGRNTFYSECLCDSIKATCDGCPDEDEDLPTIIDKPESCMYGDCEPIDTFGCNLTIACNDEEEDIF